MTRRRLRPAHDAATLAEMYRQPHDAGLFPDHALRVSATIAVAQFMAGPGPLPVAADLSCGNGEILRAVPAHRRLFGDLAPGYEYAGPIERTLRELPDVDLLVCSETIEHLDDPDAVLRLARTRSRMLVLSTPVDAWDDDNAEHYWAWSRDDVEIMLTNAGWRFGVYVECDMTQYGPYTFGIWGLR